MRVAGDLAQQVDQRSCDARPTGYTSMNLARETVTSVKAFAESRHRKRWPAYAIHPSR